MNPEPVDNQSEEKHSAPVRSVFSKSIGKTKLLQPLILVTKWILICILIVYIPMATIAFISDWQTETQKYAAILLSADAFTGSDHWLPPIAFLGSYPGWTLYFNSRGLKTDYVFSATYNDFVRVLCDDKYQSIVVVGQGSRSHWKATDQDISIYDIARLQNQFKRKQGEWFQMTCSHREFSDIYIGDLVMTSGISYAYGDQVSTIAMVIDAIVPFKIIKTETRYRIGSRLQN